MWTETTDFIDFDGQPQKETHCFHMDTPRFMRLLGETGVIDNTANEDESGETVSKNLEKFLTDCTFVQRLDFFEKVIRTAHGVRDGNAFTRDPVLTERYMSSLAYDAFFTKMLENKGAYSIVVFNGMLPPKKGN